MGAESQAPPARTQDDTFGRSWGRGLPQGRDQAQRPGRQELGSPCCPQGVGSGESVCLLLCYGPVSLLLPSSGAGGT